VVLPAKPNNGADTTAASWVLAAADDGAVVPGNDPLDP